MLIAVVMLAAFMVVNLIASPGVAKTAAAKLPTVVGGLAINPAPPPRVTYCRQAQEVPANVADAFIVPVNTVARPGARTPNLGAGDFDCFEPLTTRYASSAALISFFVAHLESRGWNLFSTGGVGAGAQALFQKAGTDGFYWVVGITTSRTTSAGLNWKFTIYQNSQTI